ncbi:Transcriptional regulator, TetR family [Cystobacter fuscus DSM 2262]|uniref:Transcriptional regulator, TetR family n=1 Tax=Cystobacter fuscus (strain ATCC 25194 / DSM 2262 / NBRC 100088 / M29) TaxID=1242864 RepID=S9P352_CYSF2|nr:TetR/AcrR family transcriptional regulator [Cystobacter fuscus]EPX58900.1 Transcriptional regulator, TetR family [Cystobacter fuscus DSM 2262]
MGNREDLLAGARRCLYEKGYARTTARDIAAAAGTSLAAIGYHFKSTEALMNAALVQTCEAWGEEMKRALAAELLPEASPLERFEAIWKRVFESFATHRGMVSASLEVYASIGHVPEVREQLATGLEAGRVQMAQLFQNLDATADRKAWAVGSFYQALLSGLLLQWLVDPERAPSSKDLTDALRTIAASVEPTGTKDKLQKGKAKKGKAPPAGGKRG